MLAYVNVFIQFFPKSIFDKVEITLEVNVMGQQQYKFIMSKRQTSYSSLIF